MLNEYNMNLKHIMNEYEMKLEMKSNVTPLNDLPNFGKNVRM